MGQEQEVKLIGLVDPQENDLSLDMWSQTDGIEIKRDPALDNFL